jgi:hypothetical protein
MSEQTNTLSGFADTFLSKLKEQSFVIILMLGVIYYQHRMMEERVVFWQIQYEEKDKLVDKTTKEDKEVLLQRINYLQDQRDKYVEDAIDELKTN